jgi:hypothetical protein
VVSPPAEASGKPYRAVLEAAFARGRTRRHRAVLKPPHPALRPPRRTGIWRIGQAPPGLYGQVGESVNMAVDQGVTVTRERGVSEAGPLPVALTVPIKSTPINTSARIPSAYKATLHDNPDQTIATVPTGIIAALKEQRRFQHRRGHNRRRKHRRGHNRRRKHRRGHNRRRKAPARAQPAAKAPARAQPAAKAPARAQPAAKAPARAQPAAKAPARAQPAAKARTASDPGPITRPLEGSTAVLAPGRPFRGAFFAAAGRMAWFRRGRPGVAMPRGWQPFSGMMALCMYGLRQHNAYRVFFP